MNSKSQLRLLLSSPSVNPTIHVTDGECALWGLRILIISFACSGDVSRSALSKVSPPRWPLRASNVIGEVEHARLLLSVQPFTSAANARFL